MKKKDVFILLRFKITFMVLVVLAIIFSILIGLLNLYLKVINRRDCRVFITELMENEGYLTPRPREGQKKDSASSDDDSFFKPSLPPPEASIFEYWLFGSNHRRGFQDYYVARLDKDGKLDHVLHTFSVYSEAIVDDDFISMTVNRFSKHNGGLHNGLAYGIESRDYGYLLVVIDRMNEIGHQHSFVAFSSSILGMSLVVAFFLSLMISALVIRPVQAAFINQKQFIADASHELKTPVAVISANIDVLEHEFPDNKWLGYIKTENERMGTLVKDMLYLAKDDAGKTEFARLPFDLSEAAACAVLPFESVAFEQKKTLEINTGKNMLPVMGDEAKIKQAIIVLVDNALKNSEPGSLIRVTAGKEGNRCFVKVYNTGHGISPEDLNKIFNRFFRSDSSRARSTGGYGLGLAIAQSIAVAHKGKISVESEENKYALFTLQIPSSY